MQRLLTKFRQLSKGFTVVEMIVVITVSGILITTLFGPLNDLYDSNNRSLKSIIQTADTRGALRSIEHGITLSYSFYNTNQIADPIGTTWNWTGSGTTSRVLITGNYATTIEESIDTANARTLVYSGGCSTPLFNNYIYFVSGGTLYRRTLKNTSTACSGSIGQKQTCQTGATNPACEGTDAKLLTDVTNFTIDYYANPQDLAPMNSGGSPPHTLYTDNTVPANAKAIEITLTTETGNGPTYTKSTSKMRITRVNGTIL